MTDSQKETLRFYTANDYLLINGLLWGESREILDRYIELINEDGRGVMAEAVEQGFGARWNCTEEEGERLFRVYQRRFPVIDGDDVKGRILEQAKRDIINLKACMKPLDNDIVLYRNIHNSFVKALEEGAVFDCLGFSSCSLAPHIAENAEYGSGACTLAVITVPAGASAIRLDLMPDVRNEPDEVILAPMKFLVTKIDRKTGTVFMTGMIDS